LAADSFPIMKKLILLSAIFSALTAPLSAVIITGGATGLTGSFSTITFDAGTVAQGVAVTNQFAGATFGGSVIWDNSTMGQIGSTGFSGGTLFGSGTASITFASPVSAAAFAILDQGATFTFEARLGGVSGTLVESFSLAVPFPPGAGFVGFQGILFDTIKIVPNPSAAQFSIDTVQYKTASGSAPDAASTLVLLSAGLACLTLVRRKNS
jgi:hypothetical protein